MMSFIKLNEIELIKFVLALALAYYPACIVG